MFVIYTSGFVGDGFSIVLYLLSLSVVIPQRTSIHTAVTSIIIVLNMVCLVLVSLGKYLDSL